ncbi:MAG: hypothetical protein RJQ08_03800 [Salinisphaeraceae bacterium]
MSENAAAVRVPGVDLSHLTDKQRTYAELVATGVERDRAADLAGYAPGSGALVTIETNSKVQAAVAALTAARLQSAAPAALALIERFVRDEQLAPKIRLDAAKDLLNRGGYLPPRQVDAAIGGKSQNEMSSDELRAFVDQAEKTLAERARPVGNAALAPQPGGQPTEFLD